MMVVWTLLSIGIVLVVVINFLASYFLTNEDPHHPLPDPLPRVAVLIAARNEEANLSRCLRAIEQLRYPPGLLSIWIGNDSSTDKTREIASQFAGKYSNWQVLDIFAPLGHARGKANVLAQLAQAAADGADYYFITDADVAVNPAWIRHMLRFFAPEVAIVNGTTVVEGQGLFSHWQRIDWAFALGLAKAYTYFPRLGETITAIGNNMAIKKDAYEAVGGYESIPFSITEDYELHKQLAKIGYRTFHSCISGTKAYTLPAGKLKELLHQRKRWMTGAMQLPLPMVLILFFQSVFFPALLILLIFFPIHALLVLFIKLISQHIIVNKMLKKLEEPPAFPFIGYELYSGIISFLLVIFYFLPIPVRWKERSYR